MRLNELSRMIMLSVRFSFNVDPKINIAEHEYDLEGEIQWTAFMILDLIKKN